VKPKNKLSKLTEWERQEREDEQSIVTKKRTQNMQHRQKFNFNTISDFEMLNPVDITGEE